MKKIARQDVVVIVNVYISKAVSVKQE